MSQSKVEIRLTQMTQKGGCAAKLPAGELRQALHDLGPSTRPKELILGAETLDDACLWDLGNGQLLVQTLDFFTPIVDDPYDFGRIAAANSISDIYAMGGKPITALSILAFPSALLAPNVLTQLLQGARSVIQESGAVLAGGHTIDDDTLKLGFSVSGLVDSNKVWRNSGAMTGDALILTKALGTGTLTSAAKSGSVRPEWLTEAVESMVQLNNVVDLLGGFNVHAATDITGFGLAGHAMQMAQASGKTFEINTKELVFLSGAKQCIHDRCLNRAHRSNRSYVESHCQWKNLTEDELWLCCDPQTSGGLLLSIPENQVEAALLRLQQRFPNSRCIGTVKGLEAHQMLFL